MISAISNGRHSTIGNGRCTSCTPRDTTPRANGDEMVYFDEIPNRLRQRFSRVRRTSGGAADSYGDATFTETTTTGFRGFFQIGNKVGESVILAGKEISYDAVVYTSATIDRKSTRLNSSHSQIS